MLNSFCLILDGAWFCVWRCCMAAINLFFSFLFFSVLAESPGEHARDTRDIPNTTSSLNRAPLHNSRRELVKSGKIEKYIFLAMSLPTVNRWRPLSATRNAHASSFHRDDVS